MMMAAAGQQEGFNFGLMNNSFNDFSHGGGGVGGGGGGGGGGNDDDDFAIDADAFFSILDEDDNSNHLPFPVDPFYPSTDNTQESGSAILANDHMDVLPDYGAASENSADTVEALEQLPYSSPPEMVLSEANDTSFRNNTTVANTCQLPSFVETEGFPIAAQDWYSIYKMSSGFPDQNSLGGVKYDMMSTNLATRDNMKSDLGDSRSLHPWSDTKIGLEAQVGAGDVTASEVRMYDFFDGKGPESIFYSNRPVQHVDTMNTFDNSSSSTTTDETSAEPYHWRQMDKSCLNQRVVTKDEVNEKILTLNDFECKPSEVSKGPSSGFSFGSGSGKLLSSAEAQYSGLAGVPSVNCHSLSSGRDLRRVQFLKDPIHHSDLFAKINSSYYNMEGEAAKVQPATLKPILLEGTLEASQSCLSEGRSDIDDGNDLCIIENMSEPSQRHPYTVHGKSVIPQPTTFTSQCATSITPFHQMVPSGTRSRASDERLIFQSLVQDLSQPKSEASAPDGSLAVPLLRHQRIALSWMVQKETNSLHCSGGILADDQGLGKTVSTIALILTERPVSAGTLKVMEQGEPETLDLDEDDDKKMGNSIMSSSVKGRPSAGTLVVCPTSVLRQWAEELANKVTSKANLSVYVYHGSNRTKDPYELAKYDVVLTTYSIVSMEVPKQPVVLKNGSDGRKSEVEDASAQFNRKRKHSSMSDKKRSKRGTDNSLVESVVHPLARVGWFRVVLDEAQSIKNHRTRVAQACWGLRAKRRWCLSGTPIQNAVDDLYSYFRFLKYDPYSVYNSFCSMVKFQISKNPSRGYQKLQAVLKNIMLRRTKACQEGALQVWKKGKYYLVFLHIAAACFTKKGTLLDGKPIINLPPKSVKLKKVEFSEEEREFYSRLEADSRAQFQAYADSGTVKQNYVNILLMLLRLRQACDHPFLVKGYDSSSVWKSSIQTAKKLSRDRQISLLSCLEASQAICGICSDPPEDAVVSICGHVFCNQCISERFTADDNVCPAASCKSELSTSNVFSKGTLNSCLSDQDCQQGSHICFSAESSDQKELIELGPPGRFESSKIKAALEVLNSLSRPHFSVPSNVPRQPVTDTSLLDKSNSVQAYNEISNATNGLGDGNSVIKEKAIVFSQWTRMLDLLEDCLKESSIQYRRLDGTMSVAARDKAVRDFNTLPEVSVMIMSLKAASLGLNMVAACHVVLLDLWWNPTTEDQAIDRAHRIGQTRPVTVVRLTVKDTVEDRILALQQKKRELVASAFGEDEKGSRQSRLTVEDLTYLFMA